MKFTGFRLLPGLMLSGMLLACGGGGSNPPSNPLSVTTTSLSQGQVSTAYSASLDATGGTAPYSWAVKSGSLPAGVSLSSGGAISGTPTTAGASTFVATVTDSKSATADSGNLSIAISGGMLNITTTVAPTGTVNIAYPSFQLAATGGVPPYTWAVAAGSSLPAGLSLSNAGVVTGTPTAAGTFNPSIAVTDETTTNTLSAPVNFTINPAGTPLPDGNYAFQFNGTAPDGNPVAINGGFEVSNGTVAIGFYSLNELNQTPQILQPIGPGGSISVGSNGLGQAVLKPVSGGSFVFALAVPASAMTAGSNTDIRIIEFDDTTGHGMRGSGVLKASNLNAGPTFKGGYAFGFRGYDTHSQPFAIAGSFQADGNGNITGGTVDANDDGSIANFTPVTGGYTVGTGNISGLITLKLGSQTLTFDYYQVSPTELLATSSDQTSTNIPMVSGVVLQQQTGPFSKSSFNHVNVLEATGSALQGPATYIPDVTLGLLASDGNGNVGAAFDEFKGSLIPPTLIPATYTVDAATGRTPISVSGNVGMILYLVNNATAFVLGTDTSTSSGVVEAQTGSAFTNASLKGNYLGGTLPWPDLQVVSLAATDGSGNVQFTSSISGPNGLQQNVMTTGTYSVDGSTGRAVVTVPNDSIPRIFYIVSPTKALLLSGNTGGYIASLEQ